jgi:hypothetical protein
MKLSLITRSLSIHRLMACSGSRNVINLPPHLSVQEQARRRVEDGKVWGWYDPMLIV